MEREMRARFAMLVSCIWVCAGIFGTNLAVADSETSANVDRKIKGKHLDVLVRAIGYPDSSALLGDRTVYTWVHRQTNTYDQDIYGRGPYGLPKVKGTVRTTDNLTCTFKALVNTQNIVVHWSNQGNHGACVYFYEAFDKLPDGPTASAPQDNTPTRTTAPGICAPNTPCNSRFVRSGNDTNTFIMFGAYEFSAPPSWQQFRMEESLYLVSATFGLAEGLVQCQMYAFEVAPDATAGEIWKYAVLDLVTKKGWTVIGHDAYTEGGASVHLALLRRADGTPMLVKVTVFDKAAFVVENLGAIDSRTEFKRTEQAQFYCPVRAL
jgi:hypothetical protein